MLLRLIVGAEFQVPASGVSALDELRQTAIILQCAGTEAIQVDEQFIFDKEADKTNPEKAFRFWNCPYRALGTELRTKADNCNFKAEKDWMVKKIAFTVNSHLQER